MLWKQTINYTGKVSKQYFRICSKHFSENQTQRDFQYELLGLPVRQILLPNALPDKYLHIAENNSTSTVAQTCTEEDTCTVEDIYTVENTCTVEDTSIVEETCTVENTSIVEETCTVEDTSIVEETCTVENTTIVEETCTVYIKEEDVKVEINEPNQGKILK